MPAGAVYVGRGSRWGNPFAVGDPITDPLYVHTHLNGVSLARAGVVEDRAHAVELFEFWLRVVEPFPAAAIQAELGGRDLACWCPEDGGPCHGNVLLTAANPERLVAGRYGSMGPL